jgi:hypothetical protein
MTLIALLAGLPGAVLGTLWSPVVSLPLTRGFFPPHPRPGLMKRSIELCLILLRLSGYGVGGLCVGGLAS